MASHETCREMFEFGAAELSTTLQETVPSDQAPGHQVAREIDTLAGRLNFAALNACLESVHSAGDDARAADDLRAIAEQAEAMVRRMEASAK